MTRHPCCDCGRLCAGLRCRECARKNRSTYAPRSAGARTPSAEELQEIALIECGRYGIAAAERIILRWQRGDE